MTPAEIEKFEQAFDRARTDEEYMMVARWAIDALAEQQGRGERMERHHKLCPTFSSAGTCGCDANYAFAKLNAPAAKLAQATEPAAQEVKIKEATSTEASVGAFPLDASPPVSAVPVDDLELPEEPERISPKYTGYKRAREWQTYADALLSLARKLKQRLAIMTTLKLPAGGQCAECGFRYWEYKGHIIPCPLCRLAEAERQLKEKP